LLDRFGAAAIVVRPDRYSYRAVTQRELREVGSASVTGAKAPHGPSRTEQTFLVPHH
jgi:hypothetical protein